MNLHAMNWKETAIQQLEETLLPVPSERNGLDWKSLLSNKTERLAQHISAFANNIGGGLLVFGVNNDTTFAPLTKELIEETVKKLGNIAKNNLSVSMAIEHEVLDYKGNALLFVYIPEQEEKPVYLRGKEVYESFIRSAGQTVKMSERQVKEMLAQAHGHSFEVRIAKKNVDTADLLNLLDHDKFYELIKKVQPHDPSLIASRMAEYGFCVKIGNKWNITNIGAILFAKDITKFDGLASHTVIVRKYVGTNNRNMLSEQRGGLGYAVGFEGLVDYIMNQTIASESIEVRREMLPTYPRKAIREFVANALIHQDFSIGGMQVTIEIFSDRLAITNPGPPLNDVNRLIDLPPHSRNEKLAEALFLLGICEKRGSGIDRAIEAIEAMNLPAPKFSKSEIHTKVTMFPKKAWQDMTKQERMMACYQHACLMFEDNKAINNQSVRERFKLDKNNSAVASKIIGDTLNAGYIKQKDESITSRKYVTYIPYYG